MAEEFDPLASNQDPNFESGFEKLDALNSHQEEVVSSTQNEVQPEPIGDSDPGKGFNEAEPVVQPLLDLGQSEPTAPSVVADSEPPKPASPVKPTESQQPKECWVKSIDPRVVELVYWRDPKKTGLVFGSLLVLLLSLALFSVLSVAAYLLLATLTVTISFVVYKKVMAAVQKTNDGHPFKAFLEMEMSLPEEKLHQVAESAMRQCTQTLTEVRRLLLVEDMVDSLKFGLMLWVLTYIGAWFNGMTLLILALVGVFSFPKFYETYKVQIDSNVDLIKTQVNNVLSQVKEKLPLPGKKKKE